MCTYKNRIASVNAPIRLIRIVKEQLTGEVPVILAAETAVAARQGMSHGLRKHSDADE